MLVADPLFVGRRDDGGDRRAGRGGAASAGSISPCCFLGFALLVLWKHRANIARLIAGTEPKVGQSGGLNAGARRPDRPAAADPVGEYRPGHLFPAARPLRLGAGGARRDPGPRRARRRPGAAARLRRPRSSARSSRWRKLGARHLFLGQGLYPPLLAELETAPPALIVKGDLDLLDKHVGRDRRRAQRLGRRLPLRARRWRRIWARRGRSSSRAWRAGSIRPRMTARSTPARSR